MVHNIWLQSIIDQANSASTPKGLQQYSRYLIKIFVGDRLKDEYVDKLSSELTKAEQFSRDGKRKLISENSIAELFNHLLIDVQLTGKSTPESDQAEVHALRKVMLDVSPNLSSVNTNKSDCYPIEATLVLLLLLNRIEKYAPSETTASVSDKTSSQKLFAVKVDMQVVNASTLLNRYLRTHSQVENMKVLNNLFHFCSQKGE